MPATARRSKSEAYEKGIREGRAMAARSRNIEPEEGEEEEEEMDMAMQPGYSRKRSAKGAKATKAPMDGAYGKKPMDAECGCSSKKGGKCDGNCGSMRKRGDSLSPLEYLDACELGIQDRSTTYIRARLDAAERLDLKCGKGSISEGEKCTKGAAQKVQPQQYKRGNVTPNTKAAQRLRTAANVAAAAGALAPLAGLAAGGGSGLVAGFGAASTAFKAAGALNTFAKAQETSSAAGKARLKKEATFRAISAGGSAIGTAVGAASMARTARRSNQRASLERLYRGPSARRPPGLDSEAADAESRMDPRGTKVAAMEAELAKQAAARGLKGARAEAYIYGTLNKMGYKQGSKTTRKGAAKAKRSDSIWAAGFDA
jgi:hypothetical protein